MNDRSPSTSHAAGRDGSRAVWLLLAAAAVVLHLGALWLVLVSGLVAPLWALLVGGALWLLTSVPLVRALREGSRRAPLFPLALLVVWIGLLSLGGAVLGWTA